MKQHIRYIQQRDTFRCGPIAIVNMLKWLGVRGNTKRMLKRVTRLVDCRYPMGTPSRGLFAAALWITVGEKTHMRKSLHPKIASVLRHTLKPHGCIILNFLYTDITNGKRMGHYLLLTGANEAGTLFTAVNWRCGKAVSTVTRHELVRALKRQRYLQQQYPIAWFVTKKR